MANFLLPIGRTTISSGKSHYFNIYDTWKHSENSTVEIWKDTDTNTLRAVHNAHKTSLEPGSYADFLHDQQTNRCLFCGQLVATVPLSEFREWAKENLTIRNIPMYVYK